VHISTEKILASGLQNVNSSESQFSENIHPRILRECASELAVPLYICCSESLVIKEELHIHGS